MNLSDEEIADPLQRGNRSIPPWLVLPAMLALLLLGVMAGRMTQSPRTVTQNPAVDNDNGESWTPSPRPTGDTVSLAIEYGNGASNRFEALPWREGMTVHDLLIAASRFRPSISFAVKGEDALAYVTSIDRFESDGATRGNWIYEVNGEKALVGMGAHILAAGDAVLWKFATAP